MAMVEDPSLEAPSQNDVPMTPMMEQYFEIRLANPGMLLFYRMGDFYELFFEDAEKASGVLGIALTKRGKHKEHDIPMCGVPVHSSEDYLQKLIAHGFRVAICDQIESPTEARKRGSKSLVRRAVVRLVTPGTITEDKLLPSAESNFLLALSAQGAPGSCVFGFAWIDISTGAFHVQEISEEILSAELSRVAPKELLVTDSFFQDSQFQSVLSGLGEMITPLPDSMFDPKISFDRLLRFYGVSTLEGFGSFSAAELSAICAIVSYLERTQKSELPSIGFPSKRQASSFLYIDSATRCNLELLRALNGSRDGALLSAIDCTLTGAGARLLSERLLSPLIDPEEINKRLDSISFFLTRMDLCDEIRSCLKGIADMPRALSRLSLNRGGPRDLGVLSATFQAVDLLHRLLRDQNIPYELMQAFEALSALPHDCARQLAGALSDPLPILCRDGGFIRLGYDPELDEMRALRDESRRIIARMEVELIEETQIRSLKIRHNNVLGYYIEINSNHHAVMESRKERFIHRQTMANAMRFITSDLADLETRIAHAADRALALEISLFEKLVSEVVSHGEVIRSISSAIAVLDVSSSLAFLAARENFCRPCVDTSLSFEIMGGRHLVVEQALCRSTLAPFVSNDCNLSPPLDCKQKNGAIWLLTGPNMGGKSTFLRQNALIVIMAQMGSFVPARQAHIGVIDQLFSRVGASDDLARGRSTFMVEMVETAIILNQATERSFVILDEIGRGTSTFDGLSIAWAAIEYLHNKNMCRAIFATHFHEMSVLSQKLKRLRNVTMNVKEWKGNVVFMHEIVPGSADRSYGVQVARLAGLPPLVVQRAEKILLQLEKGRIGYDPAHLIDDMPLFKARSSEVKADKVDEKSASGKVITEALSSLDLDALTPLAALETLYRLKSMSEKSKEH